MPTTNLKVQLPKAQQITYPILVGSGLINQLPEILKQFKSVNRYVIITDKSVEKLYGKQLLDILTQAKLNADLISFPSGEKYKNEKIKMELGHSMLAKKYGRDTMVLSLGGGVVGDMAGFVAATYMRGVPYIQIPTSFLAMVDSSIGGKVGVDTEYGKNLIGAFWHPKVIIADMNFLKMLPEQQLLNGLMEAIKIFLTYDKSSFEFVMKNLKKILDKDEATLQKIIARAIELKIGVVTRDEHEQNERMVVNWGHTIGHAIEHLSRYTVMHGFAVAYGILVESKIAEILGVLSAKDFKIIEESLKTFNINRNFLRKFKILDIVATTQMDKKNSNGKVKYILLKKIGKVKKTEGKFGHPVSNNVVEKALKELQQI